MPTHRANTGISAEFVDADGIAGQFAQAVQVLISAVQGSTYATSGLRYYPILNGESFGIQFRATRTGRLWILLSYAMSVANGGDMNLTTSRLAVADGENPNGAPAAESAVTWTPGNDANRKTQLVDTGFNIDEGDDVTFVFTRSDGGGAHTGSLNLLSLLATVVPS